MSTPSVFAPPAPPQLHGRAPGRKVWARFAIQRLSLLIIFPITATLATWARPEASWWMGIAAGLTSHGIGWFTTALHLSSRFRGAQNDVSPVLLLSGEWLDRADFRRWMWTINIERFIAAGTLSLLVLSVNWPQGMEPIVGLFLLFFVLWSLQTSALARRFREAVVAFVSEDPEQTIAWLEPILHNPLSWPHWRERDAARVWIAQAYLRLGRLKEAEALLHHIRRPLNRPIAQRLLAQIRVAHGQPAYAHALQGHAPPAWPSARLQHELMLGLLDLHTERYTALVERSEGWDALIEELPPRTGAPLRFLRIAGHIGDQSYDRAAVLCGAEPEPWSHYSWMAQVWPAWDALMKKLPETR